MSQKAPSLKVVGIFTVWNFNWLARSETVFKKQLDENPMHPFKVLSPNVYYFRTPRQVKAALILVLTIVNLGVGLYFLLYSTTSYGKENVIFPIMLAFSIISMYVRFLQESIIVLDCNEKMYEYYKGGHLVYRGHFHNIYIRLKGQKSGGADIYYEIVLNGYLVDEYSITRTSTKHDRLAQLGRRLAHRLDLNFFDCSDKCRYHVIRHTCPYGEASLIPMA